jgi:hypothetical protein
MVVPLQNGIDARDRLSRSSAHNTSRAAAECPSMPTF